VRKYAPNPLKSRGLVKGRRNQTDSLPTGDLTTAMLSQNFEKILVLATLSRSLYSLILEPVISAYRQAWSAAIPSRPTARVK
jgi:hypothetical protein